MHMQTIHSLKSASHLSKTKENSITEDFVSFEWSKSEVLIATNAFFFKFLVPITRL